MLEHNGASSHMITRQGTDLTKIISWQTIFFPNRYMQYMMLFGFLLRRNKMRAYTLILFSDLVTTGMQWTAHAEDGGHTDVVSWWQQWSFAEEAGTLLAPLISAWWCGMECHIAHYVTSGRARSALLRGMDKRQSACCDYLAVKPLMHMADGFKANAAFQTWVLDPTAVFSRQGVFRKCCPCCGWKTGGKGKCPNWPKSKCRHADS